MKNPCEGDHCPYNLTPYQKQNMCSNPENSTCKPFNIYQGYLEGIKRERPKLLPYVSKWGTDEDTIHQLPILMYELGDLAHGMIYAKRYPEDAVAHRGFAKVGMMDVLAQLHIICEREGWDFDELDDLGIEHCIEKITRKVQLGE